MIQSNLDRVLSALGLGFDDVLIEPSYSDVTVENISLKTRFSRNITLINPFITAPHHTITETRMAIALAQLGSIGIIHKNMPASKQVEKIEKVKRFQAHIMRDIPSVSAEMSIADAMDYKHRYGSDCLPVIASETHEYQGMLVLNDADTIDPSKTVADFIYNGAIPTFSEEIALESMYSMMDADNAPCAVILNKDKHCVGLVTAAMREKQKRYPNATIDSNGRLRVAAAIGAKPEHYDRVDALIACGVDAIVIDVPHGHSKQVKDMVTFIRRQQGQVDVVAGNICTTDGALAMLDAGVDAVKVACCPDDAVGIPPLSSLLNVVESCSMHDIPVIADMDIHRMPDIAKAFAAGASTIALNSLCKDAAEIPANRGNTDVLPIAALLPPVMDVLRSAMYHTGHDTLDGFRTRTRFIRVPK